MKLVAKFTIFLFQLCCVKLTTNRLVLCQLCGQCGSLRFNSLIIFIAASSAILSFPMIELHATSTAYICCICSSFAVQ